MSKQYKTDCLLTRVRYVGCTVAQHRKIGVHAQINARGGEVWRNDSTTHADYKVDQMDLWQSVNARVRIYHFRTRFFRKHFGHVLARHDDF